MINNQKFASLLYKITTKNISNTCLTKLARLGYLILDTVV